MCPDYHMIVAKLPYNMRQTEKYLCFKLKENRVFLYTEIKYNKLVFQWEKNRPDYFSERHSNL